MQKFGLQRAHAGKQTAIELEIAKEQASALGRTGRKLRISLESYQAELDEQLNQESDLLQEIANNVWELMLQREFIGFVEGNLKWVRENYVIPDEAINKLGERVKKRV